MVVLASRISDAFPANVNANDFWGSITLGFLANYMGIAILPMGPDGSTPPSGPPL